MEDSKQSNIEDKEVENNKDKTLLQYGGFKAK